MPNTPFDLNRAAYDQIAPQYARKNSTFSEYMLAAAERMLVNVSGSPLPILDLGCGAGRDLSWFETHGARAMGADLSTGMLALARQAAHSPLAQMDMRFLGFESASFAGVWCIAALLHLPHAFAPVALAEMARVLAPGGSLYLCVQKGSGEGNEPTPYDENIQRFYASYESEEMSAYLHQAGFTILNTGENFRNRPWLWFDAQKAGEG